MTRFLPFLRQSTSLFLVAVSATLPNIGHLASFVESGEAYSFDQSYRPVPLNVFVQACGHIGSNRYLFDKSLNQHVPSILKRFSSGRTAIVFCHSKKETEDLAGELTKSYANPSMLNESALANFSDMTETSSLHQCIRKGIAFHHAGLDASDRRLVEQAFGSGSISCLCATSTLAVGVNLPSHLVGKCSIFRFRLSGISRFIVMLISTSHFDLQSSKAHQRIEERVRVTKISTPAHSYR